MYGYRRDLIDSILHVLTRPSNKVVFKLPKSMANLRVAPSKIPTILQGNIRGTVFSGYPGTTVENTTTTLVNSLVAVKRAWGFGMFRQIRPNTKVAFFHAGDDLMALGNIRDLEKYQLALSTVIGFNDSTHNNGQRARDVDMGGTNMDFLSKKGLFLREQSFLYPLISRVCWRGAINHNADLSDSELNYCNVKDLESWSSTLPGFRNVLHELSTQP